MPDRGASVDGCNDLSDRTDRRPAELRGRLRMPMRTLCAQSGKSGARGKGAGPQTGDASDYMHGRLCGVSARPHGPGTATSSWWRGAGRLILEVGSPPSAPAGPHGSGWKPGQVTRLACGGKCRLAWRVPYGRAPMRSPGPRTRLLRQRSFDGARESRRPTFGGATRPPCL
jgi:hypothetical protein